MRQIALWTAFLALGAAGATAQYGSGQPNSGGATIKWGQDVAQAVEQSRKSRLPLMFWVIGSADDRAEMDDVERDQIRAFGNPQVLELSKRFICCKMSRSRHAKELEKWRMVRASFDIAFVTPAGEKIDELSAGGAKSADVLAQKMGLVFSLYRQQIFEKEVAPILKDEKAPAKDLKAALETIDDFTILTADKNVLELLKRPGLDDASSARCIEILGGLATKPAVDELFERSATDKRADEALRKAPAGAAEYLLEYVGGADPGKHLLAYDLVCHICKIKDAKKPAFWDGKNDRLRTQEIERVKKLADQAVKKWKDRNEHR